VDFHPRHCGNGTKRAQFDGKIVPAGSVQMGNFLRWDLTNLFSEIPVFPEDLETNISIVVYYNIPNNNETFSIESCPTIFSFLEIFSGIF
jgi:hypothetical protein